MSRTAATPPARRRTGSTTPAGSTPPCPSPEDVARLIFRIREHIDRTTDGDPLTALRIVGELDTIVDIDGCYATRRATRKHSEKEIADALGATERAATARLRRYDSTRS